MALVLPILLLGFLSYSNASSSIKKLAISSTQDTMFHGTLYEMLFENVSSFSTQVSLDQTIQDFLTNQGGKFESEQL